MDFRYFLFNNEIGYFMQNKVSKWFFIASFPFIVNEANANYVNGKTQFGITVKNCGFDYDPEDFCSAKNMRTFSKVMKERKPNFVDGLILYIYKSNTAITTSGKDYRMVVIDPKEHTVDPFYYGCLSAYALDAYTDSTIKPMDKPEFIFNTNSNLFCVKGDITAYRNSYSLSALEGEAMNWESKHSYDRRAFCFPYVNGEFYVNDWR